MMPVKDEDPFDNGREHCVGCNAIAPATETNYTLISQRHGWRLTRATTSTGRKISEWRCPECFEKYRPRQKI